MTHSNEPLHHHIQASRDAGAPLIERLLFGRRPLFLVLFLAVTLALGFQALHLKPEASFEKMIPTQHPYIVTYLAHKDDVAGLGNAVRIAVETTDGDIFTEEFQKTLKAVNDEVFLLPGVNRTEVKSIWTPNVRWTEVTEEGFIGGPVIPDDYDGSARSLDDLRTNVMRSGEIGTLVSNDLRSALIYAPLFDLDPDNGEPLDYQRFSERLETLVRDRYQSEQVRIHITGFAKIVGDLIDGATEVAVFFGTALLITLVMLYLYSRCVRSSLIALLCSVTAIIWQLGLLKSLGFGLDPYSMLVPFLVFAIGVSHGVQIINAVGQESLQGADRLLAARRAFRSLYVPGLTALVSDGIGFATLLVIQIQVIQDLAIAASIGVAVIILSNLVLLPILMSYTGVSPSSMQRQQASSQGAHPVWTLLSGFTGKRVALGTLAAAAVLLGFGLHYSQNLRIGDLDAGAPELRPDSRYNRDNAYLGEHYSASTDIFVTMVKTAPEQCMQYDTLASVDRFKWHMQNVPGVQSVSTLADYSKRGIAGMNEGNLKWLALNRNQQISNMSLSRPPAGMLNFDCSLTPVIVYLNDHRAETLTRVVAAAEDFAAANNSDDIQFLLAAGNAGIEAATNRVISTAQYKMLAWVYGVVGLLCLITFRSLRTLTCILVPLAFTSVLCQALMAWLGIGIKVATLPVIALGVGIGVDYGIYIYSKLETYLKTGMNLHDAYFATLKSTGKAVAFTGLTLAIGVGTWVLSPIKFQADMGILLTFMFLCNMLGALVLLPALARLLVRSPPAHIEQAAEARESLQV
ncbi:MAG: RND family transporter [Oceanospirillaceae bacterium]|nr:RND family transporter [Oceanospirillaceae bacterium]